MDISILLALQEFRNGAGSILTEFMSKMTFLGELNTVIVIMTAIYWCVSREFGSYLLMGWSGNRLINGFLKITACAYRPWIRDPRIVPYGNSTATATGYSFPSGHTTNASAIYGGAAVRKDKPVIVRTTLGAVIFLVALSRMFLGVHTPQDVIVGAGSGLLVMWLCGRLMTWVERDPGRDLMVAGIGIALAAALALYAGLKSYPADYDAEGRLLVDGAKMANDTFKGTGWSSAFLVGWILERRFVRFSTDIPMMTRVSRLVTGLLSYYAVSLILVPLLKGLIPGAAGTIISCFLQMFFVSFIFPWCISRFEKKQAEEPCAGTQN